MKPLSPELSKFRKEAKHLKKAFIAADPDAIARITKHISQSKVPKHADFLFIIAREQGHDSWPKLKFAIETTGMSWSQKVKRLSSALYLGQKWVVEKLLAQDPELPNGNLDLQIALYDKAAVTKAINKDPAVATREINGRLPLHHLCFSHYIHIVPVKKADMLALAELLVKNGADINLGMQPEKQGGEETGHLLSPLYGALGHANNMDLASWLLDNGADPNDNESLYHATELGHHEGLKLLIKHGVKPQGTNALARALDFNDLTAVSLLLDHGADPNEIARNHPSGQPVDTIPALHQAARRQCSAAMARLLLENGADPNYIWQGHSAYALALIHGNAEFAEVIKENARVFPLTHNEEVLASCASGAPSGRLCGELGNEDHLLINKLITEPDRLDHVKALVSVGLDINQVDGMNLPPLHAAGWAGLPDQVEYLLSFNPDLEYLNGFGGNAFFTTLHGAANCPEREQRDHIACADLLLKAGATFPSSTMHQTGSENMASFLENWLEEN